MEPQEEGWKPLQVTQPSLIYDQGASLPRHQPQNSYFFEQIFRGVDVLLVVMLFDDEASYLGVADFRPRNFLLTLICQHHLLYIMTLRRQVHSTS